MRKYVLVVLVGFLSFYVPPCLAESKSESIKRTILERIRKTNQGPRIVNVTVEDGQVELSGSVSSEEDREVIGHVARSVPGIDGVSNNLLVDPDGLAELRASAKFPIAPDDAEINENVVHALTRINVRGSEKLKINTNAGLVDLSGSLANHRAIDHVLSTTLMVEGVRDIQSEILIGKRPYTKNKQY